MKASPGLPHWLENIYFDNNIGRYGQIKVRFSPVYDDIQGVKIIEEKFCAGEKVGEKTYSSLAVRRIVIVNLQDRPYMHLFEVFSQGKSQIFEAEPGIEARPVKWRNLLLENAPGAWMAKGEGAIQATNAIMYSIGKQFPFLSVDITKDILAAIDERKLRLLA